MPNYPNQYIKPALEMSGLENNTSSFAEDFVRSENT